MRVTLHLPAPLRPLVKNRPRVRVEVEGRTVADLLVALTQTRPELAGALLDEQGALRRQVTLYVGDDDARHMGGSDAALAADVHVVVPTTV
jgi:molybdopterin synthase sulfur carrier subunit